MSNKFTKQPISLAVTTVLCSTLSYSIYAEESVDSEEDKLNVITITASRREASLLKTPIAVTAVTQETLTKRGITNIRDIASLIPNMELGTSPTDSGVQASVRGVTSTNFTEIGDPSVSVHIDGFYSPRPQASIALMFDVDRVEALRGPQGTLFGRNSPGGTINVISKRPEFDNDFASVMLDVGSYNKQLFQFVGNLELSDDVAIRASFMNNQQDSWVKQNVDRFDRDFPEFGYSADGIPDVDQRFAREVNAKDSVMNTNEWGGRLALHWSLSPKLNWDLSYEHYTNDSAGSVLLKDCEMASGSNYACSDLGQWEVNLNVPGMLKMDIDSVRSILVWDIDLDTSIEWRLGYSISDRQQATDGDSGYHALNSDLEERGGLNLLEGVPDWGFWGLWPLDDWSMHTIKMESKNLINEFQLSQDFDNWSYVAGVFIMRERTDTAAALDYYMHAPFGFPSFGLYLQPDRRVEAEAVFAQADWILNDDWTLTLGARQSWDSKSDQNGRTWEGPWDGVGGYTDDGAPIPYYYNNLHTPIPGGIPHNGNDLSQSMGPFTDPSYLLGFGIQPTDNSHTVSWSKLTWRAGIQYQVDENSMAFGSVSTGYKSGGFGDLIDRCGGVTCVDGSTSLMTNLDYKPETVTNYEVGIRSSLLDETLHLSMTAFFMDYNDMQFTGTHSIGVQESDCDWAIGCELTLAWKTENIGRSEISGIEVEFDYIPWNNGSFSGYYSWLNTQIKEWDTYSESGWFCGNRGEHGAPECANQSESDDMELRGRQLYDVRGNQLPYAPEFSVGFNLSHDFEMEGGYSVVPNISLNWQDDMYFTARNLNNDHIGDLQKANTMIDASVRLSSEEDWYIEFYGTNLTDELVKNWMSNDQADFIRASYNAPRMYGVRGFIRF